jgi:iron complex transport system substrate-binding protein
LRRIVSFLPSSTEILYEIGVGSQIVGVTHECNYPLDAKNKMRVVNSSFDARTMSSQEIDNKIGELTRTGADVYVVDDVKLKEAKPDLIIAQGICEVCAPATNEIRRTSTILGYKPDILVLDPHDLDDILISIMDIAQRVDKVQDGRKLVLSLRTRIDTIRLKIAQNYSKEGNTRPRVLCLEWIDPFFTAGHWVPQMVDIAGGVNVLSSRGQPSRRITVREVLESDPDKIIMMPCGFDIDRTLKEVDASNTRDELRSLRAFQNDEVYVVDAGAYFSKPGPRVVTGLEILAKISTPELFADVLVPTGSFTRLISKKNVL